jgi:TP901 family phage tail tape measure protein
MSDIILSVDGDLRPLESKLSRISSKNISLNLRDSLSQPLGRITGKVSEFEKSLEASNARVLAFGASAGAVYAVQRAFGEVVKATIEVEKSLTDINVVLNASARDLGKFGKELFGIAKNTGQGFDQVAKAATEFARQGLGIEETLKRTSDALILSRLSGLDAARSVETLTAAVNTFSRAGLTSTQIINKLANVDAAFAVSTKDLAEAISRVGSTAQDVGVDFDQLIAIVTAAQQTTARGGAVIGNSFKTIFTRLQRTDTLDALEGVGIAVKDLQGNTLPAVQILKNLSDVFYTLSDAQRASVAETVGGVFQINILRAALSDLTKEYSIYNGALSTARSSTDQAIQRNKALNETLSALTNKTFVNLLEAAAKIGEITIAPTLKTGLGGLNAILEEFNKPEELQGTGTKIATGILKGIGSYISGPGLAVVGAAFIKIFGGLTKFSAEALKSLIGISSQSERIAAAQQRVNAILAQNPALIQAIISKEASLLQVENQILRIIQQQNAARAVGATISARVAPAAARVATPAVKTRSAGYIPNFVSPTMQEKMGAYAGGYTPGAVKKMGGMYYNTAESVVQFAGADGPAIIPPQNSIAGENYRSAFRKQVGFDPYAYRGYVPNFAPERKQYTQLVDTGVQNKVGMIFPAKTGRSGTGYGLAKFGDYKVKIGFPISGYNPANIRKPSDVDLTKQLGNYIVKFVNNFSKKLYKGQQPQAKIQSINQLANAGSFGSITGAVFETAVGLATGTLNEGRGQNAPIDFDNPTPQLRALFNNMPAAGFEAKVNANPDQRNSTAQKILDLGYISDPIKKKLGSEYNEVLQGKRYQYLSQKTKLSREEKSERSRLSKIIGAKRNKAFGHIPNFAALQDAIAREQAAGVNPNLIRVGTSSSLMSRSNPLGLGVYNMKDEPAGLQQGVNRYSGRIPNFAEGASPTSQATDLKNAADKGAKGLDKHTKAINDNQGRLLALGVGLSILQGSLSQVGDQNSKFARGLNQTVSVLSTVTTGLGVFGGGRKGIAATGGMLAIQGVAGLSANADKTFASQMETLDKALESTREQASKLESVVNSVTPQINAYVEELEKAEPDPEAIAKFKKAILEGVSTLGPELQEQIRNNLESPKAIMGTLSKAQRAGGIAQNQIGLQQLVLSEQGQARANMGIKGQFGRILSGTGIPGLAGFGQGLMQKEMQPTFGNQESITKAATTVLEPIAQSTDDLLLLADVLSQNSDSASAFFSALEALYQGAGQSTQSLLTLREELSKNPAAAQKMVAETIKLTKSQLANAAAASKMGAPTAPGYKGSSKLYGAGMVAEQYEAQPIDDLNASLSRLSMISGTGPGVERLRNKIKARASLQQAAAGMPVSEDFRQAGATFYGGEARRKKEQYASLLETTGQKEEAAKVRKILENQIPQEQGLTNINELIDQAGKDVPKEENMSSVIPPVTEELKKLQEQAAASAEALKQLEQVTTPAKGDLVSTGAGATVPAPDILNTLLTGGGGLAALVGGGLSFAGGALPLAGKLLGGGANVVKGAGTTAAGAAGGAANIFKGIAGGAANLARGAGTAAAGFVRANPMTSALAGGAALGYGAGELFDPGAEKRTSMLESIPGAKEGLSWWSQNAPTFLGGGGASGLTEEEKAAQEEQLKVAQQQSKEIRAQKLARQQAVGEVPTAAPSPEATAEAERTAATPVEQQNQINNNISVAPSINIAQQAATDKAELQKMIEAEVKKFGEAIVKIADDKAKAREKGVVNPPQKVNITA